jgi:hypothetical protein
MTLVEQELFTLSSPSVTLVEHELSTLSSPSILGSVDVAQSLVFRSVFVNNCLPFQLVIVYRLSSDFRRVILDIRFMITLVKRPPDLFMISSSYTS